MSVKYIPVTWNYSKYVYDAILLIGIILYIWIFLKVAPAFQDVSRPLDGAVMRMRAFGTCAYILLSFILCIGPLARLDKRFLPLLYNRRHFGVLTCSVAFTHASYVMGWYFSFSPTNQYIGLLVSNANYGQVLGFPFEAFGIFALIVLLILAATSHDFWLSFLSPPLWKKLHMGIYFAYVAIVLHIVLGAMQSEKGLLLFALVLIGAVPVCVLHFIAARKERLSDLAGISSTTGDSWVSVGDPKRIPDQKAIIVSLKNDERVAIYRNGEKLSAISNVCAHQNGPLGEGKIVFGCVTCPWHGYQYNVEDGRAPAPFTEKISTYKLKLSEGELYLDVHAQPPGTYVEPVVSPVLKVEEK